MDKFDLFIQNNPVSILPKKGLAHHALEAVKQIKRIKLLRNIIGVIFVVALLLLITKWLQNDLLYLVKVLFYKFSFVKSQSTLYLQAFSESLPKVQLLMLLLCGALWIGWKYFETFIGEGRINDTRITMKMIRMTPWLAITSIVLITFAAGISTYAYAQKTEQKKLEILREHINQSGRTELQTNQAIGECGIAGQNYTNQYEIKKGVNMSSADAKNVITAYCNSDRAEKFLNKTFSGNSEDRRVNIGTTITSKVIEKANDRLVVKAPSVAYSPNPASDEFLITSYTKVYKDNIEVPSGNIKKDDIVMLSVKRMYATEQGGDPISTIVLGIYILPTDPIFKWYDLSLQHSVTQVQICTGNPEDRCSFTGSIDFFPSGGGEGNTKNPLFVENSQSVQKEIAGSITDINSKSVKIKTTYGRIFTLKFESDPVGEFNKERSKYYENKKIGLGDTLLVTYSEAENQHATTLESDQIFNAVLMLEIVNKTDPIQKY